MKYRPEIDGLRAIAIIPVILNHAGYAIFSGGYVGVDVFFVISGYLITAIICREIEDKTFSLKNFYVRRIRRILPLLYVVVITTLIACFFIFLPKDLVSVAKSAISIELFASNFYFWSERGYFGVNGELKPLLHTWSLGVEEQFYIFYPLALIALWRLQRVLFGVLFAVFITSIWASYYVTPIHFDTAFYFPMTRAWELLAGSFCALALHNDKCFKSKLSNDICSAFGLGLVFLAYFTFDSSTLFPYVYAAIPVIGVAIFILASQNANYIRRLISSKILVYIGVISYSLYLWHQPVFAIARHIGVFEANKVVALFIIILLSILTFLYVERPLRNGSRISTKAILCICGVGFFIIAFISLFYILNGGFYSRYPPEKSSILKQMVEYQGYNQTKFDALQMKKFTSNDKRKIVLIGDSYAKDFINIIDESNQFDGYEFSTRQINSECGNLMIDNPKRIQMFIPDDRRQRCAQLGRYEGEQFDLILKGADEIWLVSAWSPWVIDFIQESISNISNRYDKPVRVFGLKNFGVIELNRAVNTSPLDRVRYTQSVTDQAIVIENKMNHQLGQLQYYYPIMDDLCGGEKLECKIFTNNGYLMTIDGGHLTREGAIEAGSRLAKVFSKLKNYSSH